MALGPTIGGVSELRSFVTSSDGSFLFDANGSEERSQVVSSSLSPPRSEVPGGTAGQAGRAAGKVQLPSRISGRGW